MTDLALPVNPSAPPTFAALTNVVGFLTLIEKLRLRDPHLPNLGVMYGHSGLGKSYASIYAQNKTNAIRIEVGESWNKKMLIAAILRECGANDVRGTIADLTERAILQLADTPERPLIVDEADKLVAKGYIELIREIAEKSQAPVLLIGEEELPRKLEAFERVHNRVLDWYGAERCDLEDCRRLAAVFLRRISITDDLLDIVRRRCDGRARRIVVTFASMAEDARNRGIKEFTRDTYKGAIFTGASPRLRSARSHAGDAS